MKFEPLEEDSFFAEENEDKEKEEEEDYSEFSDIEEDDD